MMFALFAAVCMFVALFAHLWQRRFRQGPLERLWSWADALPGKK